MSTVKDKMIEALAIYVAEVRDGRDASVNDEDVAANAWDILAEAASDNMEGGDYGVLSDLLLMPVEDYLSVPDAASDNKAALKTAAEILLKVAESL